MATSGILVAMAMPANVSPAPTTARKMGHGGRSPFVTFTGGDTPAGEVPIKYPTPRARSMPRAAKGVDTILNAR
eukprot:CAMPEP_0202844800 /NCGR_PEP_ID=MMETSP1389-20130828/68248_1 /ASSEMBLY_ACC=CAM_ASM_000865 /TAXON_ID=302021 /ORGANISM="Rhodomonas sp., Strain CCMP768" /LENGTH=73 /DNA_ID=CAMNT_0049522147 /DNA_START=67 /DNA_END=284 /DNA_ORIENTATION=-